jgi:hypothetical protein
LGWRRGEPVIFAFQGFKSSGQPRKALDYPVSGRPESKNCNNHNPTLGTESHYGNANIAEAGFYD